jgi:DNA primase
MNILQFFEEFQIKYWIQGKNVSKGHVNIQCPFCNDQSNHLGINILNLNKCNCWKCGRKNFVDIVAYILEANHKEAKLFIKDNIDTKNIIFDKEITASIKRRAVLPKEATDNFPKMHLKYLKDRGFNPNQVIKKFNLKACGIDGRYKFRIIIPIYQYHKLVSFTSRDITNKQKLKYLTSPHSLIERNKLFFNFDSVSYGDNAIIVEGPMDAMKIGDKCFSFLGVGITNERILEISKKKINNLYIFFDRDHAGRYGSEKLARTLAPLVKEIHVLRLTEKKDPGELTLDEVQLLRQTIEIDK